MNQGSLHSKLLAYTQLCSMIAVAVGILALLDRLDGLAVLGWRPEVGIMKTNTALAFILSGIALWALSNVEPRYQNPSSWMYGVARLFNLHGTVLGPYLAQVCAVIVATIGGLTVAEYLFDVDMGIDHLWLRHDEETTGLQGRMAPMTAFNFALLGLALLVFDRETSWGHRWSEYLVLPVLFIGGTALVGYFYGEQSLYKVGPYVSMAISTAALFFLCGLGVISARPGMGLIKTLANDDLAGLVARKVLPFAILPPLVAGGLQIAGERRGWFGLTFGVALLTTVGAASAVVLIWWLADYVNQTDIRRRRVEGALRQNEERLRFALEATSDGLWDWNIQTGSVYFSPRLLGMLGYKTGEIEGHVKRWEEWIHPGDRARVKAEMEACLEGRTAVYTNEHRLRTKEGEWKWNLAHGKIVSYDRQHRPLRMIGTHTDITEQKRIGEALLERNEWLRLAMAAGKIGTFEWHIPSGRTRLSPEVEVIYGLEPGSFDGTHESWLTHLHHEDWQRVSAELDNAFSRGEREFAADFRIIRPDGAIRWIETRSSLLYGEHAQPLRITGVNVDVTERKRAEQALQESEEHMRVAAEAALIGLWNWDIERNELVWTDRCRAIFGLPHDTSMSYARLLNALHPDDRPKAHEAVMRALAKKGDYTIEFRAIWADGSTHWVDAKGRAFFNDKGTAVRLTGVVIDVTERKKIETAMQQREERYRRLVQVSPDSIVINRNNRIVFVNEQALKLLGAAHRDEILGQSPFDLFHPDCHAGIEERITTMIQSGDNAPPVEEKVIRLDGAVVDVEVTAAPFMDQDTTAVQIVLRDITERKRADEAVRESEARFRSIFECNIVPMGTWSLENGITAANDALLNLLGYDREDLLSGKIPWFQITPVEYRPLDEHAMEETVAAGICTPFEKECVRKDGSRVPVLVGGAMFSTRRDAGVFFALDLTQQRKAAGDIKQSEERFRLMVEEVQDYAIFMLDPEGWVTTWNIGAERANGYRSEDIIGRHFSRFYTPEDVAAGLPMEHLRLAESQGKVVDEGWRRRKDGSQFWADVVITAIRNDQDALIGFSKVTRDLTEYKRVENDIRRLLAEAKDREQALRDKQAQLVQSAKLASIGELATGLAHEMNNPLNNIGLFIGNAIDFIRLDKPKEDILIDLQDALKQVHRGASIINHLRAFGRTAPMQMEPVLIDDVIRSGLSLMQEQLRLCNIDVVTDLSAKQVEVLGNSTQLEQVFVNLLGNARDAVADSLRKIVTIRSVVRSDQVEVMVQDSGSGISPDAQAKIFDPFYTTKPAGEGTGLGLSITYSIINEHRGAITVDSRPGEGATFVISLPLAQMDRPGGSGK